MKPGIPWPKEKRERDVRVGSYRKLGVGQGRGGWGVGGTSVGELQGFLGTAVRAACPPARPSEEMVKMVLSRPCHPDDQFTTSILRHWCMKHDELLAEHIKSLLIKNNSLPRKRQR